jgi:hypothetical protein
MAQQVLECDRPRYYGANATSPDAGSSPRRGRGISGSRRIEGALGIPSAQDQAHARPEVPRHD